MFYCSTRVVVVQDVVSRLGAVRPKKKELSPLLPHDYTLVLLLLQLCRVGANWVVLDELLGDLTIFLRHYSYVDDVNYAVII